MNDINSKICIDPPPEAMHSPDSSPAIWPMDGVEVPIPGSEKVRWVELTVPSSSRISTPDSSDVVVASSEIVSDAGPRNAAACHVVSGESPVYLFWRIHGNRTNVLELLELSPQKEFPEIGLQFVFPEPLFTFSFICGDKTRDIVSRRYLLYALTASGVAYLFKLGDISSYVSGSVIGQCDYIEFSVQKDSKVTAVAATFGCLLLGREDGLVTCYQLGLLEESSPGFVFELRDDLGLGRLWSLVSRGRNVCPVKDLTVSQLSARKVAFVLHSDGTIRVWDLHSHSKVLNHAVTMQEVKGLPSKIWVGEPNYDTGVIPLVVLYESATDSNSMIVLHSIHFIVGEKITLASDASVQTIPLDQGVLVDLKLTARKLYVLKEDGSMLYDLHSDVRVERTSSYGLQEDFISDLLFQDPAHPSDELMWNETSFFSSQEQVPYILSSIFLSRLLQPGVHQTTALRATILNHRKYATEHTFQSLSVAGLKRELFSILESEGLSADPMLMFRFWKKFCSQFVHYWNEFNRPYSLFVDSSTGTVGLIRKASISIFRHLEHIELLIHDSFSGVSPLRDADWIPLNTDFERDITLMTLKCISNIRHQLGRASSAAMLMSLINKDIFSFEDITSHLLKILETGYSSPTASNLISRGGVDASRERKQEDDRSHRKFSIDMVLCLQELYLKASSWSTVFDIFEKYIQEFIPKSLRNVDRKACFNVNSGLLVQATSQMAKVMLESSFDMLLFLRYLVNVGVQASLMQNDVSRIRQKLIPVVEDIVVSWLTVYFVTITPTEPPSVEDFSSCLSSLHIGSKKDARTWKGRLGSPDVTLAFLLEFPASLEGQGFLLSDFLPQPGQFFTSTRDFAHNIIRGKQEGSYSSNSLILLASTLLIHGQHESAEVLLNVSDAHSRTKREYHFSDEWIACLHLLGFCIILRAHSGSYGPMKEVKVREASRCFFRTASGGPSHALANLPFQTGLQHTGDTMPSTLWKFHYYQWAMQVFEQYNMSEGACQFALAALEQVDEVLNLSTNNHDDDLLREPATTIRGRLWSNVFKFMLDLNYYRDAYCAIISNPDDESKYICLRRFIIVLCERGPIKVLCDGVLPFVGLLDKVEQELFWKAERSDIATRPNLYKILYSFESHRNNWRKAASYMYRYTVRLRTELNFKEQMESSSSALEERIWGLSAAISALKLVNPAYAWIDSRHGDYYLSDHHSPNKRARKELVERITVPGENHLWITDDYLDIANLEKEYVLASAHYLLALEKDTSTSAGYLMNLEKMVNALVQASFYDMAFTVLLKFWQGSALKRELERVFVAMSEKCCENRAGSSFLGSSLLLTSTLDGRTDGPVVCQPKANVQWETLEIYLEKYQKLDPRLPVTVAETLLQADSQIELPLWLIHMFKAGARTWGMTGQEADPATLLRLYVDYGRYAEATTLLLEYLESFSSMRPTEIVRRKRMSAIYFPYTAIERLWFQLEEVQKSGRQVDECQKLKGLMKGVLSEHLKQVKVDSEDALACGNL